MFLQDYGDEPVQMVDERVLLSTLAKNYNDPETILIIAKMNPAKWYRTSPYSWFCYVPNSPYRT